MKPYKTLLPIDPALSMPVYLQISQGIINVIQRGTWPAGTKLPGSRKLAQLLEVHRKTVIAAYEELEAQGWIVVSPSRGTFVAAEIPEIRPSPLGSGPPMALRSVAPKAGFYFQRNPFLPPAYILPTPGTIHLADGLPDTRLAPLTALSRHYRSLLNSSYVQKYLSYTHDLKGNLHLRKALAQYFLDTRGIQATPEQILLVRGGVMGFFLLFRTLVHPGDSVIVGETSYRAPERIVQELGGKLLRVPVDDQGIQIDRIEDLCQTHSVKVLYVCSHHHYPTTVSLSADRRLRLLMLAEQYGFAIIEDDYDYDFHYASSPLLPLASLDTQGFVAYVGSLSKTIAPAIRMGFVVAPEDLIEELSAQRRYIDRQGDILLERAIAILFEEGEIRRHLRKALRIYHQRRDIFCNMLQQHLQDVISFDVPEGGLAIWAKFTPDIDLETFAPFLKKRNLNLNPASVYNPPGKNLNATRLGFAALTEAELTQAVHILKRGIEEMY